MGRWWLLLFILPLSIHAHLLQQDGKGSLSDYEGAYVLHLKGTPYERGYQHGSLLKEWINHNVVTFIDSQTASSHPRVLLFKQQLPNILPFIPASIMEELQGLSEGSEQPFEKLLLLNLFPEMFHCSGITVQGDATASGKLYHVRALDYSLGKDLQHSAVLMLIEPDEGYTYLNISYAGFIGCVTGMNAQKIALGEIGGHGYGSWEGMPMAFLMKEVLEKASSLEEARHLFAVTPRTCEYYYLISDGNQEKAAGVYATARQIHFIESGTNYTLLAPNPLPDHGANDKRFLSSCLCSSSDYQMTLYDEKNTLIALFHKQPEQCIVLTGFTHPGRYPYIIQGLQESWGHITHLTLQSLLNEQTTLSSNLHNAIFLPSELKVWIAHAGHKGERAHTQKYICFDLKTLLKRVSFH